MQAGQRRTLAASTSTQIPAWGLDVEGEREAAAGRVGAV